MFRRTSHQRDPRAAPASGTATIRAPTKIVSPSMGGMALWCRYDVKTFISAIASFIGREELLPSPGNGASMTNRRAPRIASPEMLPEADPLSHVTCVACWAYPGRIRYGERLTSEAHDASASRRSGQLTGHPLGGGTASGTGAVTRRRFPRTGRPIVLPGWFVPAVTAAYFKRRPVSASHRQRRL